MLKIKQGDQDFYPLAVLEMEVRDTLKFSAEHYPSTGRKLGINILHKCK